MCVLIGCFFMYLYIYIYIFRDITYLALIVLRSQYVLCTGRGLKPLQGKSHVVSLETEPLYDSSSTMDGIM